MTTFVKITLLSRSYRKENSRYKIKRSQHQNVSILDLIGAKDDGGGRENRSYLNVQSSIKSPPPTNQHPVFRMPQGTKYNSHRHQ